MTAPVTLWNSGIAFDLQEQQKKKKKGTTRQHSNRTIQWIYPVATSTFLL